MQRHFLYFQCLSVGIALLLLWSANDHALIAQQAAQTFESVAGRDAAPRRVLVKFRDSAGVAAVTAAEQETDADVNVPVGRDGRIRLIRSRSRSAAALAAILRSHPDVEFVEPDYVVRAVGIPNDSAFQAQWGLRNIGLIINGLQGTPGADVRAEAAWNIARGSSNVVIGVIDGGFDYDHPDLAANVWSAPRSFTVTIGPYKISCPAGTHGARFEFATATCNPSPVPAPHATNVAGIAGAVGGNQQGVAGMSWRTSLMSLNFLLDGQTGYVSDAINAVDFALQIKSIFSDSAAGNIRVLNNSWIGAGFSQALQDAIDRTAANDILWIGAAGNSAVNIDSSPDYPASFNRPNQLTLAASNNRDERAAFSNYSPTKVHMAAPGQDIYSTLPNNTYGYYSGTSMASPMTAGAAALVLSRCPMNTADLKSLLITSIDPLPAFASITVTGGRLNVAKALQTCAAGRAGMPPSVSLTAPLDRSSYSQPVTLRLDASAADTDGSVVNVAFYAGSTLIGSSSAAPYSTTWASVPSGTHALKAIATDNDGMQTTSDVATVSVGSGGGAAQDIVIHARDIPGSALHGAWTMAADSSAADGTKLTTSDSGFATTDVALASPAHYFDVTFNAPAGVPYAIWLRLNAGNNNKFNDSVWVQFSDATANGSPIYPFNSSSGLCVNLATDATATSLNGWGWQNRCYWLSQPTQVTFTSSGTHTMRIQLREDGVQLDQIVLSPGTYLPAPPGPVSGDRTIVPTPGAPPPPPPTLAPDVVIYASDILATARRGTWTTANDSTSPAATKLVTPNNGIANVNAPLAAPADYIDVPFSAQAGVPYRVWFRLKALNNDKYNDAIWVQFSDARANGSPVYPLNSTSGLLVNLATDAGAGSLNNWGWANGAYWLNQATTLTFGTSGTHTLRIQVREDGVQIDQIVFSPNRYLNAAPGPAGGDATIVGKPGAAGTR